MPEFKVCYGIDVTGDRILAVRSTLSGRRVEHQIVPWDRAAAGDAAIAACLSAHECFARRLTAPFPSVAKAGKVFPSILDIQIPFPIEKCVYRFLETAAVAGDQVETLAIAVRHEDLTARLEKLAQAGIDPTHLDHEGLALWSQSIEESPLDLDAPARSGASVRVVLYLGEDRTTLVIGRGRKFIHAGGIRTGTRHFPDAVDQLVGRIQQVLRSQVQDMDTSPMQWAFTGPGAEDARWTDAIRNALRRPESTTFFTHKAAETFLPRALASRALTGGPYRCNLRAESFEHPSIAASRDRGQHQLAATCLGAGLLLCLLNLGWRGVLDVRRTHGQDAIEVLSQRLSGLQHVPRGQEVIVVERALEERKALVDPFSQALAPSVPELLAAVLDQASQSHVTLDSAMLGSQSVVLRGRAATWEEGDKIAGVLRQKGWNVSVEKGDAGADEKVPFTIKAVL